jgi:F-type H+-transporting ATPase subunit epsilon
MAGREFAFSVVAPDKSILEETVTSVVAPGTVGYFGVYRGHIPMISSLKPGLVEYTDTAGARHFVYVGGGFAEVSPDRVTILADEGDLAKDIDLAVAESTLENARRSLRGEDSPLRSESAVLEVDRAVERLKAARLAR